MIGFDVLFFFKSTVHNVISIYAKKKRLYRLASVRLLDRHSSFFLLTAYRRLIFTPYPSIVGHVLSIVECVAPDYALLKKKNVFLKTIATSADVSLRQPGRSDQRAFPVLPLLGSSITRSSDFFFFPARTCPPMPARRGFALEVLRRETVERLGDPWRMNLQKWGSPSLRPFYLLARCVLVPN